MSEQSERIVKKLWSYCQVLRDDGLSYQDYLEQLTFLLFLKMADERADAYRRAAGRSPRATAGPISPTRRWRACSSNSTTATR
jgi:type I restriction-modification system DNA methylase subunit